MSSNTYTLTCNSKLTEDYIHATSMVASSLALTPMATFINSQGQSEALLIHEDGGELCHLQREPLSSSGWNIYGIGAQLASIAAANSGSVWVTTNDGGILQSNAGHWNTINAPDAGEMSISVGQDGTVYCVGVAPDGSSHLFVFDPVAGQFNDTGVVPILTAPVGNPGALWAVDATGQVWTNSTGTWEANSEWGPINLAAVEVQVGTDGSVWVLGQGGLLYSWGTVNGSNPNPANWTNWGDVPAGVTSITSVSMGQMYALAGTTIQAFSLTTFTWSPVPVPQYEVLSISAGADGTLWALNSWGSVWYFDGTNWNRQMMPTDLAGPTSGLQVTEVVTGRHSDGVQYAFYVVAGSLCVSSLNETKAFGGYWNQGTPLLQQPCSHFAATYDTWSNGLVVYGITDSGLLVIVQNVNGSWTASTTSMLDYNLAGATVQFTQPSKGGWVSFVVLDGLLGCYLELGLATNVWESQHLMWQDAPQLQTVVPFPAAKNGYYTCVLDTDGQLWYINAQQSEAPQVTQLSGASVGSPVGAITDAVIILTEQSEDGASGRVFARDANNTLWILRFTAGTDPKNPIAWAQWHPLGDPCTFLATGPASLPSSELFMLDEGGEVAVLSEDLTNMVWNELVMLKPQGSNTDAEYVSRYLNEITVTDQTGSPVPNFQISVTSDMALGVWVGTSLYNVGTTLPAQLTTNQAGQVTFAFFADDIHTPTFSFAADGLIAPPTLYPAQEVNDYLSGSTTALPGRPSFDAAGVTLSSATMQSAPDWVPGATTAFVQTGTDQSNAPAVAQAITQVYTIPLTPNGNSGQWSPDDSARLLGSSSFWNDLCTAAHDIDHAIKKAALTVSTVAVDIANKVARFTMELANGLSCVLSLVINTVEDVVSAVKSAFRYIERGILEAIDWLKSLFAWGDVLNTKHVFEAGLTGLMSRIASNLDPNNTTYYAGNLFNTFFDDDGKAKISTGFDTLQSKFGPSQSFSNTSGQTQYPSSAQPMGPDALHPSSVTGTQSSNGPHTNYVHGHVTNYSNNGGNFPSQAGGDGTSGDSVMQTLYSAISSNLINNNNFTPMETCGSLQSIFSNPKAFADVAIYDVLNAVKDAIMAILDVIEGVFDALFQLAGNALAGFQKVLTTVIDIPVISWIYKEISGDPLTLLDLLCLVLAVPATIVYKLTFGMPNAMAPFSAADVTALEQQYAPANFPWPAALGGSTTVSARPESLGSFPFPAAGILMVLNGATYAIFDCLNDLLAHSTNVAQLKNPEFGDPIATFFSWVSVVTTLIGQWLTAPYSIFPGPSTEAEKMTLSLWSLNFIPFLSGLTFTVVSKGHALEVFNSSYGVYLSTAIGLVLEAVGIATTVEQVQDSTNAYGPCYWVQNILAPIPTIFKPLVSITSEPDGDIATGCLVVSDAVMDVANCSLAFVEDAV